jgi:hypothetical protein
MKVKGMNDKGMDGLMWIELAKQYLEAINGGTVPSIESSWTYICKQRLANALDEAKKEFDKMIEQEV